MKMKNSIKIKKKIDFKIYLYKLVYKQNGKRTNK